MSEYLIIAENITYKNNKLSCINIFDNFSAVALPAEFVFDLVVICGPNWAPGEKKLTIKAKTNTDVMIDVGEITVNIPNEDFVYNAMAQNLRITVDYSIKDLTFLVYEGEQEILSRKYTINSLLVPAQEQANSEGNKTEE
ncbi:MAG: hypothetical protein PHX18_03585 [Candidatus Gastranaerophilales bacterium]|nr:hypothetical protein [Candidatus Gastranaerophilales bacterium]